MDAENDPIIYARVLFDIKVEMEAHLFGLNKGEEDDL